MEKLSKYAMVYTTDGSWDATGVLVVEAESPDDIDNSAEDILLNAGLDLADADEVVTNGWYFLRRVDDVDASVQY